MDQSHPQTALSSLDIKQEDKQGDGGGHQDHHGWHPHRGHGQPAQLISPSQSHHLPQSTIDHDVPADQHAEDQLPLVTVDVRYQPTVSQPHSMPASLGPARSFPGPAGDLPRTVPKENQSLEPRTSSDVQMPARSKPESAAVLHQSFTGQHPPCQSSTSVWVSTSSSPSFISALEDSKVNASSSVTIGSGQSLPAGRQLYPPANSKPSATDRKQEESGSGHRLGHSEIDHLLIKIYLPVASHHMALLRVRLHHNKHHNALPNASWPPHPGGTSSPSTSVQTGSCKVRSAPGKNHSR
jgi:hypothetical protein